MNNDSSLPAIVPNSVGALLAEEWTINPYSALPSFLEMILIEEATKSTRGTIASTLKIVSGWLVRIANNNQRREQTGRRHISMNGILDEHDFPFLDRCFQLLRKAGVSLALALSSYMQRFHSELGSAAVYFAEKKCLDYSSSTVGESFYGVRRAVLGPPDNGRRRIFELSAVDKTRLALLVAFGPYAQETMDRIYQRWNRERDQKHILAMYPMIHSLIQGILIWYQWRYLLGQSFYFDLKSLVLGQIVRRTTSEDTRQLEPASTNPDKSDISIVPSRTTMQERIHKSLMYLFLTSIAISWLTQIRSEIVRVLQDRRNMDSTLTIIPPPPPNGSGETALLSDRCPLCRRPRVNPVAATSGHVFCLSCLLPYVRENGKCPLTGQDCPESRIIRLYEPHH